MLPLQGLYAQLTESANFKIPSPVESALVLEGNWEALQAGNDERATVLNVWRNLVEHDPISRAIFQSGPEG